MGFMGFHFCWDEVRMIALAFPFVSGLVLCGRFYWHKLWHKGDAKSDGCCEGHDHD